MYRIVLALICFFCLLFPHYIYSQTKCMNNNAPKTIISLGIDCFKNGNDSLALSYLKPILQDSAQLDSQQLIKVKLAMQLYYADNNLNEYSLSKIESLVEHYNNNDSLKIAALHRLSYDLIGENKNIEAIKYIKDALAINDTSSSIYYIPLLLSQAHAYEILEQHQEVVETFYRILQSKDIKENYYYIGTLQNAARYYNRVGNVEEAFKHIKKAIKAIDKSNFDKYAELLSDLARFYYDSNKKDKGINLQEEVIEIRKSNLKDDDDKRKLAISLSNLIYYYDHNNDSVNSFYAKHELIDSDYPLSTRRTYSYAYELSYHYYKKKDIEKAVHYGIKAVELFEKDKEEFIDDYIGLICYLRDIYVEINDYEQAIIYQKKYIDTFTDKDSEYATAIALLAQYYAQSELENDNKIAIKLLKEAITIRGKIDGTTSESYLRSKFNLGTILLNLNRYSESIEELEYFIQNTNENLSYYNLGLKFLAEAYHQYGNNTKAIDIIQKLQEHSLVNNDSITYIDVIFNLAKYDLNIEKYETHLKNCLSVIKNIREDNKLYIDGLITIGTLYNRLENHDEAIKYNKKALNLEEKYFGKNSKNYVARSTGLFGSYLNAEMYNEADSLAKLTLPIAKKLSYSQYIDILNNYSIVLSHLNRHKEAIECEKEVLKAFCNMHGSNSPLYATACHNLAYDFYYIKEYKQAIDYFKIALNIRKQNYFNNPVEYILSLEGIMSSYIEEGLDYSFYIHEYININKELLSRGLFNMTDEQRYDFSYKYLIDKSFDYYFYNGIKDPEILYDYQLFYKDILLNFSKKREDKFQLYNWKTLQSHLSENDIAIEFICYRLLNQKNTWSFDALLLKKDWNKPKLVNLFTNPLNNEMDLDNTIHKINDIWKPIMDFINPNDNVFFSLVDILNWFPIESLLITDNRYPSQDYIMSDIYNMFRLSSTKEIVNIKNNKPQYTNIALYGGLNYDISNEEMISESRKYSNLESHNQLFVSRGLSLDSIRGYKWNKLDNSLYEVDYIENLLKNNNIFTYKYVGNSGNEESFKSLSSINVDIIHLATHGFFLEDKEYLNNRIYYKNKYDKYDKYDDDDFEISMLNTGLILSGGNKAWQGKEIPESIEDGILLAKEISQMNLKNTDLVILSACEGGSVGSNFLGNFGLSHAFKMAGVQSLIMNLTEVDDQTASIMMKQFYTNLMSGQSKHKAFYNAQRYIRKIKPDYKYWSGWIMLD